MKKKIFIILLLGIYWNSFSQYGYKRFFSSLGVTGKYMKAPKYTGYDFNATFIARYNFVEINFENTISVEIRPQIGIGTRDWYIYGAYPETFPTRMSYALPVLLNYNWGLNAEENSIFLTGISFGAGYNYSNVVSDEPPYEAIQGPCFNLDFRVDANPVSHISFLYTLGNDDSRMYSVGFFYDF